jgi:small subunit ribosomal protein S18
VQWVDYKDDGMLRKYMSDRGKIRARRVTGNCAQHQREIALAIKTARELVLLPYTQRTMTERSGGRGRPGRGERPAGPGRFSRAEAEQAPAPRAAPGDEDEAGDEVEAEAEAGSEVASDAGSPGADEAVDDDGESAAVDAEAVEAAPSEVGG